MLPRSEYLNSGPFGDSGQQDLGHEVSYSFTDVTFVAAEHVICTVQGFESGLEFHARHNFRKRFGVDQPISSADNEVARAGVVA